MAYKAHSLELAHFASDMFHHGTASYPLASLLARQTKMGTRKHTVYETCSWENMCSSSMCTHKAISPGEIIEAALTWPFTRLWLQKPVPHLWLLLHSGRGKHSPGEGSLTLRIRADEAIEKWATRGRTVTPQQAWGGMGSTFILKEKILETY